MKRIEKTKRQTLSLAKETLRRIHSLSPRDLDKARGGVLDTGTACKACSHAISGCG
jgi:hypothetical protein